MTARRVATFLLRAGVILVLGAVLAYLAFALLIVFLIWIHGGAAEGDRAFQLAARLT